MKIQHTTLPTAPAKNFNDWAQHIHNQKTKAMKTISVKQSKAQYKAIVVSSVMAQTCLNKDKAIQMVNEQEKVLNTGFYIDQTVHLTATKIVAKALTAKN